MNPIGPTPASTSLATPKVSDDARLKKTASQLEAVFVQRMFAAMRDTVPDGGIVDQSSAEQTFTSLMDEKVSEKLPSEWTSEHSLAHALYNQLHRHLLEQQGVPDASNPSDAPSAAAKAVTGSENPK